MNIDGLLRVLESGYREKTRKSLEIYRRAEKVMVFMAEDVYSGPYASKGPDLIALGEHGFDMKGSVKKKEVFGRSDLQGMHTWDDALFLADSEAGKDLAIQDLAGIILKNYS